MHASASSSTAHLFARAAHAVSQVIHQGRSLEPVLQDFFSSRDDGQGNDNGGISPAALQALAFGTLRWYPRLACWIDALSSRPADQLQPQVQALLAVGLHQLEFSKHPAHAIVHQAVEAADLLGAARAGGLINAILRKFLREQGALRERAQQEPVGRFAHPQWLIDAIRNDWPDDWEQILAANNQPPPMWLRANRRRNTAAGYLALLAAKEMNATAPLEQAPAAVLLAEPVDVRELPGFEDGLVSVQDAGAQLAALLLDAQAGMRVLDACAAPGGKTCHVLERTPDLAELVAVDRSAARLKQLEQNLVRLKLQARIVVGNAARPDDWWDGKSFQRILLDVPCSATGVIRRHPDIKVLRRPTDAASLAAEQLRLLRSLWPLLEAGGCLLYASCSVLRAENEKVIAAFLDGEPAAAERKPLEGAFPGKHPAGPGVQILPGQAAMDGFYYACLEKRF